jgi:splicing factor 3B subunit 3
LDLKTQADRILISDFQESVHFARYLYAENRIIIFADDTTPRWTTKSIMIDYNTVAGGDKFGNFFINRLPEHVIKELDDDATGGKLLFDRGQFQGAQFKVPKLQCDADCSLNI